MATKKENMKDEERGKKELKMMTKKKKMRIVNTEKDLMKRKMLNMKQKKKRSDKIYNKVRD